MDKREFFDKLHKELTIKYNTTEHIIAWIRTEIVGKKKTRKQLAEEIVKKLHAYGKNPPKSILQPLLDFVSSCSQDSWNDITQKTEFDKSTLTEQG